MNIYTRCDIFHRCIKSSFLNAYEDISNMGMKTFQIWGSLGPEIYKIFTDAKSGITGMTISEILYKTWLKRP